MKQVYKPPRQFSGTPLGTTFLTYGVTELAGGYGFLAVFVAALAIRAAERTHSYQHVLHDFTEQVERLLTVGVLLLLGGAIASGLLSALTWQAVAVAVAFLLMVWPVAGRVGLIRADGSRRERWMIASFGIRGIGSLYYLAYALNAAPFEGPSCCGRLSASLWCCRCWGTEWPRRRS